jgi:tetratricopeptide (TPR) repeat protein
MTQHEEEGRLDAAMQKADDLLVNSLKRDETMRKYRVIIGILAVLVVGLMFTVIVMMTSRPSSPRQVSLEKSDPEVLTQEGWELWQQRKMREAEMKFDEATKGNPKLSNAWNGLGWARFNSGKTDAAITAFAKCVELEPNHPAALNGLGQAYYAKNQFDKAEPFFVKAANNKASAAWWGLAKMYLLQGKFEEAQKWAQKLVDAGETTAQPLLDAAKAKQVPDGLREQITPMAAGSARAPKLSEGNRGYQPRLQPSAEGRLESGGEDPAGRNGAQAG